MIETQTNNEMKELTTEQLNNQYNAINATRVMMERSYNGSQTTQDELMEVMKALQVEISSRVEHRYK